MTMCHREVPEIIGAKPFKPEYKWEFQEYYINWSVWGFGYNINDRRGWEMDTKKVYIGPLRFVFLSSKQMDES